MLLNNCKLCSRVFKIYTKSNELCCDCMKMQEAQFKVTLSRIEKQFRSITVEEIIARLGFEPHRLNAYLQHRFVRSPKYVILDGNLKGYCFICNVRNYYPYESACLDCLQRILAAIENRLGTRVETLGSGRKIDVPQSDGNRAVMAGKKPQVPDIESLLFDPEPSDEDAFDPETPNNSGVPAEKDESPLLSPPSRFYVTRAR